jgi:hypothetical protein
VRSLRDPPKRPAQKSLIGIDFCGEATDFSGVTAFPEPKTASRLRTRGPRRPYVDLYFTALDAQLIRMQGVANQMRHAFAAAAVEPPLVMRTGNDLPVEDSLAQRHVGMRASPAIGFDFAALGPYQKNALLAGLKEAHATLANGAGGANGGERHRFRLSI